MQAMCPLSVLRSNLEEHLPGNRCLGYNAGSCAGWPGDNRRVGQGGGGTHYRPQEMDSIRAHGEEEPCLPVRQVGLCGM